MSAEEIKQLRAQIDSALAQGDARTVRLLARLWFADANSASAGYVDRRFLTAYAKLAAQPYRVAILRSFTVEPIVPLLRSESAAWGLPLEVFCGEFNSYSQEILDPDSQLYRFDPHAAILALQTRDIAPELWDCFAVQQANATAIADRVVAEYRLLIAAFRERSKATFFVHTLEMPSEANLGLYDSQTLHGQCESIRGINRRLAEIVQETTGVYLLDYDALVATHGRRDWFDAAKWLSVRLPIRAPHLIQLARAWTRALLPASGRVAKALVCDLDNTLWGGVVGEEGLEGIQLGPEPPGAAYREVQQAIRDLSARGVILAICSKNNPEDALEVFAKHEQMLLRNEHFAAMQINWDDKAQNLRKIADELNIGIDSLVLLDDNPIEREFVREQLPEVTVLEWDARPESAVELLRGCPLFERLSLSQEDAQRGAMYAAQRQRSELQGATQSVEDYYRGLKMKMEVGRADAATIPRIAQLTQKTNQLNVTTRRYTEQQIADLAAAADHRVYWIRVRDRFGDNGLIGAMIVQTVPQTWRLDVFLMSCRVIGRTVETAMLSVLCRDALAAGATELHGEFLPTKKNAPAKHIFRNHGFTCAREDAAGSEWSLRLPKQAVVMPDWIDCQPS